MARVDKNHICEVRTFPKPPADVKTVMTAVLLLLGEDEHTASVSMCVCTVTEMDPHTRPEWVCVFVLWPRWLIHGQREYVCVYCGRDGSYTTSVSMWVCTVAEMDNTWSARVCGSVLWPRWIIHGQREYGCVYCGWDGPHMASMSMRVCTVAEMAREHACLYCCWDEWVLSMCVCVKTCTSRSWIRTCDIECDTIAYIATP